MKLQGWQKREKLTSTAKRQREKDESDGGQAGITANEMTTDQKQIKSMHIWFQGLGAVLNATLPSPSIVEAYCVVSKV